MATGRAPQCPICGTSPIGTSHIPSVDRASGLHYPFGICGACGLFWCLEPPHCEGEYVSLLYRRRVFLQGARLWDRGYFDWLLSKVGQAGGHVVECGSGPGWLGYAAVTRGMSYEGYELDPAYATAGKDLLGVDVRAADFLIAETRADVVIMLQLIEHVSDPMQFLRRAYDLLRPGGLLVVATPNMALGYLILRGCNLLRRPLPALDLFTPPLHLSMFHPRTFSCIERVLGLRRVLLTRNPLRLPPARSIQRIASLIRPLLSLPARLGVHLDTNLLYIAEKPASPG